MSNDFDFNTPSKEVILIWFNTPIVKLLLNGTVHSNLDDVTLDNLLDLETYAKATNICNLFKDNPGFTSVGILEVRGNLCPIYINNENNTMVIFNSYKQKCYNTTKMIDGLETLLNIIMNSSRLEYSELLDISLLQLVEAGEPKFRPYYAYLIEKALIRHVLQRKTSKRHVNIEFKSLVTRVSWLSEDENEKCEVIFRLEDETYDLECDFNYNLYSVKDKIETNLNIEAKDLNLTEFISLINTFKNKRGVI